MITDKQLKERIFISIRQNNRRIFNKEIKSISKMHKDVILHRSGYYNPIFKQNQFRFKYEALLSFNNEYFKCACRPKFKEHCKICTPRSQSL